MPGLLEALYSAFSKRGAHQEFQKAVSKVVAEVNRTLHSFGYEIYSIDDWPVGRPKFYIQELAGLEEGRIQRILVLDDDPDVRGRTVRIIRNWSQEVEIFEAGDTKEARHIVETKPVDLIVTDWYLAQWAPSWPSIRWVAKSTDRPIPIVVISYNIREPEGMLEALRAEEKWRNEIRYLGRLSSFEELPRVLDEFNATGLEEGEALSGEEMMKIMRNEWEKLRGEWPKGHRTDTVKITSQTLSGSDIYQVLPDKEEPEIVIDPRKILSEELLRKTLREAYWSVFRYFWQKAQDEETPANPGVDLQDIARLADVLEWDSPRPGETVLDLGTGAGSVAIALILQGADHVIGVDHSELQLKFAQENVKNYALEKKVEFLRADATSLPLSDQSVDKVYGRTVAGHLPEDRHLLLLQEAIRVLKPGGTFVLLEFKPSQERPKAWTKEDWEKHLRAIGFGSFRVIDYPDWPLYWIRAQKPFRPATGLEERWTAMEQAVVLAVLKQAMGAEEGELVPFIVERMQGSRSSVGLEQGA
jgi:SAM-dependent methyltransferase/CheY-like chemotaxis protein